MAKLDKLFTRKQIDAIRNDLIAKHGNKCAICEKPASHFKKRLSVDHCHRTNRIRGLLCYRCNRILVGRHTQQSARQILEYLEKYEGKEENR